MQCRQSTGAQHQGKSASPIHIRVEGERLRVVTRQAAHSSTIPCLIAYNKEDWDLFQEEGAEKPKGFVFLKGTDYYRCANTTLNMPKWVNDADREIDEKTSNSNFRERSLELINQASQGIITPEKGIMNFMTIALEEIRSAKDRLETSEKDPEVQKVLEIYEKRFLKIQKKITTCSTILEKLLNLSIDPSKTDAKEKEVILQLRYRAIRDNQLVQARLIQKIEEVKKRVLESIAGRGRKPDYFDGSFHTIFVEQANSSATRHRFEKLLNYSPFDYEAKLDTKAKL